MRRPSFAAVLFGITVLVQLALLPFWIHVAGFAREAWPGCHDSPILRFGPFAIPFVLSLYLVQRIRKGLWDERRHAALVALLDLPAYIHFSASLLAVILMVVGSLVVLPLRLVDLVGDGAWAALTISCMGLSWALAVYGTLVRRFAFVVREEEIRIAGWPAALDGFRIAQLSDLHVGSLTPRRLVERWIAATNASSPDLVVLTGDLVTSGTVFHEDIANFMGRLHAPLGVVLVMGNHDYFGGGEPLLSLLRARGVRVLQNDSEIVEKNGASFRLAGVDDTWTKRANLEKALEKSRGAEKTILLAHDPELFPLARDAGVALTLSGHTHGGQIALPWLARRYSLAHLSQSYVVGRYDDAGAVLYVHPGPGTTGPPIRFGIAPAVVIHTIRSA